MQQLVDRQPSSADAHYGLGVVKRSMQDFEGALASFTRAMELNDRPEYLHIELGVTLMDLGRFAEAERPLRHAIELSPDNPGNWLNLAVDLYRQGDDGCAAAYERALALDAKSGGSVDAFVGYASYLRNIGRADEAIAIYREHLPACPNTSGLTQLGMCLLHDGAFEEGWSLYEFRWLQDPLISLRANLETPLWQGQDLSGKSILLRAEQGVGDVVQFARYIQHVKAFASKVYFQGRDGMEALSPRFVGVDEVINTGERLPEFDYYTNLMSLPRQFGDEPGAVVSRLPYVRRDGADVERFRQRLSPDVINVGLVWGGNPTHKQDSIRSVPLRALEPLLQTPGVQFVSLQKGPAEDQLKQRAESVGDLPVVQDWGSFLHDFGDTADAIDALDLVISVDTSVAHLAGALGAPVWVLLPSPAEWRWMGDGANTDWYPTGRLFRQTCRGDWSNVAMEVANALKSTTKRQLASDRSNASEAKAPTPRFKPAVVPAGMPAIGEMREGIFAYFPDSPRQGEMGRALAWYGEWLHDQLALLARLVRLGQTVVEIDAGIGVHTVALSRLVGTEGMVFAFEGDPVVRRLLTENLRANKGRNVTVLTPPAAGEPESIQFVSELRSSRLDWLKFSGTSGAIRAIDATEDAIWTMRPRMLLNVGDDLADVGDKLASFGYATWLHRSPAYRRGNFNRVAPTVSSDFEQCAILAIPEEIAVDVPLDDCSPIGAR
jgi:Tfp pilus assembly protein PilF